MKFTHTIRIRATMDPRGYQDRLAANPRIVGGRWCFHLSTIEGWTEACFEKSDVIGRPVSLNATDRGRRA